MYYKLLGLDIPDPVVQCTSCNSMIVLKRRQNNSWMVTCQGYPACRQTIWLPATVLQAKVKIVFMYFVYTDRHCMEFKSILG